MRLLLRLVAWLCDVPPTGRCQPDGLGHYFGSGDRCQCGFFRPPSHFSDRLDTLRPKAPPPRPPVLLPPSDRA